MNAHKITTDLKRQNIFLYAYGQPDRKISAYFVFDASP